MNDFTRDFIKDYHLTTAEIYYHMPDFPELLQSYIWQEYDIAPKFPVLHGFLDFWDSNLDGKVHSVLVASKELVAPGDYRYYEHEITIQ